MIFSAIKKIENTKNIIMEIEEEKQNHADSSVTGVFVGLILLLIIIRIVLTLSKGGAMSYNYIDATIFIIIAASIPTINVVTAVINWDTLKDFKKNIHEMSLISKIVIMVSLIITIAIFIGCIYLSVNLINGNITLFNL